MLLLKMALIPFCPFTLHLSYVRGKAPEKSQPGKLTQPGIELRPPWLEATILSLEHSVGQDYYFFIFIINIISLCEIFEEFQELSGLRF